MVTAGMTQRGIDQYRIALAYFLTWLAMLGLAPEQGYEYDDLLVEYRNGSDGAIPPSKSSFEKLIACIEKLLPHLKGELLLARAELNAWGVVFATRHTVPMLWIWCALLARRLILWGLHRVAALLVLQRRRGLRPGESLGLRGGDIVLPTSYLAGGQVGALLLGTRPGTRSKRPQAVRLDDPFDIYVASLSEERHPC